MVTATDYKNMKKTETVLRSRVNDIMVVHQDMNPEFRLLHSGDDFKAKPKYADLIYGKGRTDTIFALIVPTQFKLANTPPDAVDLINETRNKIELIGVSREDALTMIKLKGWLVDSTQYGEWVRHLSQKYLDTLPGDYNKLRNDCIPRRSILRYGVGRVDRIGFHEDEVYITISMPGYEGTDSVNLDIDLILNTKKFNSKVKELTEILTIRNRTANDEFRIKEYLKSHSAQCCIKREFGQKFLDPVMKEAHTKECISKEIGYLKDNFHRDDPWGRKFGVTMTIAERIKQLEDTISEDK